MLRAFASNLNYRTKCLNSAFFHTGISILSQFISRGKIKCSYCLVHGQVPIYNTHIKPRSGSDVHIRRGDGLVFLLDMLRAGMAASGHQTFLRLRHIVTFQPESKLRFYSIALRHSQYTEGDVQLLIAVSNGGGVPISRFRQEAAPQHLIGLSIMGFLCNLKLSFGLSGHPAHGFGFKAHQIFGAFHHKFIINGSVFIGGVGAIRPHLCFERCRVGHYVKGAHRVVHGATVISRAVVLIPGRGAGADRQFGFCIFILHQISVRNIGVVPIQSVANLARSINREGELFGCKDFFGCLTFRSGIRIFQFHIGFISHGKGNIFIFRHLQYRIIPFILCV